MKRKEEPSLKIVTVFTQQLILIISFTYGIFGGCISLNNKNKKFDRDYIENILKEAGVPKKVAQEIADRTVSKVGNNWTNLQIRHQIDIELNNLEQILRNAHSSFGDESLIPGMDMLKSS